MPSYVEQTQPQMVIKGRPVTSIEEARAASIDFDGSVFYFPDLANKRIYTKQINMDGTSSFNVYEWKSEPIINSSFSQYVTRDEFASTLTQLNEKFEATLAQLRQASGSREKEKKEPEFDF